MKRVLSGTFTVVVIAVFLFLLFVALTRAQESEVVASGGSFVVQKSAVAGGGRQKQTLPFGENGTTGQAVAGTRSSGGAFSIYSGFWTPDSFVPTAANVSVSGRITTPAGNAVRNIVVTLTAQSGEVRSTLSTSLGYYIFEDVPSGETYLISLYAKRFSFPEPTRVVQVSDDITNVDFIAIANE